MTDREKAIALINAYYDGKDIVMKDPDNGVEHWTDAIHNTEYWSYLGGFVNNLDKYKIIED